MASSHLISALLLVVLQTWYVVLVAAVPPVRPANVTFGFLHNVVDPLTKYDAVQLYAGLKAAEKQINDADGLLGTALQFTFMAAAPQSANNATRQAVASAALADAGLFGFVLSDWFTSHDIYPVLNDTVPAMGVRSLTTAEFLPPWRNVIAMRQPSDVWHRVMVHNAMHEATTQCTRFVYVTRSYFSLVSQVLATTLQSLGLPDAVHIDLGGSSAPVDAASVAEQWVGSGSLFPVCGLFFTSADDIIAILGALYQDARFPFAVMTFFSADFAVVPTLQHPTLGTAPFRRLRFVSSFPDPQEPSLALSVDYRAAMSALLAANFTLPAGLQAAAALDSQPNVIALEGYMTGIMIFEFLKRMPTLTRAAFMDVIYDTRYYWTGDVILGPFMDHCVNGTGSAMPCWCNVAVTSMFIVSIAPSTGKIMYLNVSGVDAVAFELTIPNSKCVVEDGQLLPPVHFQLFPPRALLTAASAPATASSASSMVAFDRMQVALGWSFAALNGASTLGIFSVGRAESFFTNAELANASISSSAIAARLHAQRRPFVTLGDWFAAEDVASSVINLVYPPSPLASDPPLAQPTAFSSNSWTIRPTIADLAHALAMFLADDAFTERNVTAVARSPVGSFAVTAVATSSEILGLLEASLHTIQMPISDASSGQQNLSDASICDGVLRGALRAASGGAATLLVVGTDELDAVTAFLTAAVRRTAALVASDGLVWSAIAANLVVAVACDATHLYEAKMRLTSNGTVALSAGQLPFPMYFASYLYPFFEPANSGRVETASLLGTSDVQVLDHDAVHLSLIFSHILSSALGKLSSPNPQPSDVLGVIYAEGQVSTSGVVLGPFYPNNCSATLTNVAARRCQCLKAFRTLRVYDFRGWLLGSAAYNPSYSWSMPGCAPEYQPLLAAPEPLNVALVVGVAVPLGTALVVGLTVAALCCGGRSNRLAPKDPSRPFAMVFTDIQSSTALWARAPECMGEAIEQHHSILRQLVTKNGGYEVKTIGDSFMVAFRTAAGAATFALDIQTALYAAGWAMEIDETYLALAHEAAEENEVAKAAGPGLVSFLCVGEVGRSPSTSHIEFPVVDEAYAKCWNGIRVRVGLHWGMGSVKFDPVSQGYDYYGTVVNTAARVEGVGNGGQVLATRDFYVQLEDEGFSFHDVVVECLGPQPLRGLDQPVPLYQMCPAELKCRVFAALRLDKEPVDVDGESSVTENNADEDVSRSSAGPAESYLDRLLRPVKNGAAMKPMLVRYINFLETLLRVPPATWRRDAVKALMKHWHLKSHPSKGGHKGAPGGADALLEAQRLDLTVLVARAGVAAEEAMGLSTHDLPCHGRRSLVGAADTGSRASKVSDGPRELAITARKRSISTYSEMHLGTSA